MNVAVRDASLVTKRNRNKALNAYYQGWKTATVNSSNANPALTAPAATSAEVVAQIKEGCVACTIYTNSRAATNPDPNQVLYPFNPSACGAASKSGPS